MSKSSNISPQPASTIPGDDLRRTLTRVQPDTDQNLLYFGVIGDTYTIVLTGEDTAGRFCLIDMHIPPGGGPLLIAMTSKRPSPSSRAKLK